MSTFADKLFGSHVAYLQKALDAASLRQKLIAENIANASTPNYHAKNLAFESQFKEILHETFGGNDPNGGLTPVSLEVDEPGQIGGKPDISSFQPEVEESAKSGVDINKEMSTLIANQIKFSMLSKSIGGVFKGSKYVIENFR